MEWNLRHALREIYGVKIVCNRKIGWKITDLTIHFKKLKKEKHIESRERTEMVIIKTRADVNDMRMKLVAYKAKQCFSEKFNKIDSPPTWMIKGKKKE